MKKASPAWRCIGFLALSVLASLPAAAETYVVRPDATGDFATIQEAIEAAVDGDTIELADGIFTGECNRDIDYGGKSITIMSQSGDPEACIIDCGGKEGERHRGFYFQSGEDENARLEGVTIRNGTAHGPC
jgi:pectin methylesterase-like acyl-CoA thioesterase